MQKVKAFVVLRPGYEPSDAVKQEILDYCRQHIAKYAMPYDIEFRPELPKTLVGKVAYRVLEEEEAERQALEDEKFVIYFGSLPRTRQAMAKFR